MAILLTGTRCPRHPAATGDKAMMDPGTPTASPLLPRFNGLRRSSTSKQKQKQMQMPAAGLARANYRSISTTAQCE